ncbi:hypothetical protein [Saccharothrix obliqua]|uniref:hypothetical protein n=1 Tax=Saccharothrix obliqua TaxID=2861747 RepID=UPI001C5DA643|nr:hypothetical protein [Saccharothrix obliqua]MBW4715678.1 hypothetical protein [Saccharothrix obliqua]
MTARTALAAGLATGLLLSGCGKPDAAPVPLPSITTSNVPTSVPTVASISVRTTTTTPTPTARAAVTTVVEEEPPPPPPPTPTPTPPPEPTAQPTTPSPEPTTGAAEPPPVAVPGFPCEEEGATAVDPAGRPLRCAENRWGRLLWDRA